MCNSVLVRCNEESNSAAIEELKKQIEQIVQDVNLLKEQQALQTGTE